MRPYLVWSRTAVPLGEVSATTATAALAEAKKRFHESAPWVQSVEHFCQQHEVASADRLFLASQPLNYL